MKPRVVTLCGRCQAEPGQPCREVPAAPADQGGRCSHSDSALIAWVPLEDLTEAERERMRAAHVPANTIDSTAEELGPVPPGNKSQTEAMLDAAVGDPITLHAEGTTPSEGLG